jgi:transposase
MPVMRIGEESGLSWDAVNAAIRLYQRGGIENLRPKQRGRNQGTGRILSPDQEENICQTLYTKKPYQLGLVVHNTGFTVWLWSLERVRQFIEKEHGLRLSNACLSLYLNRWGLRLEKKSLSPIERCTPEIQQWLKNNFMGKREPDFRRAYWVVRKTIIATIQNNPYQAPRKKRLSVVTAINGKKNGDDYWSVYQGNFTKERQNGFMKFLCLQSDRKVLLIRTSEEHFTHLKIERFKTKNQNKIEIIPPLLTGEIEKLYQQQEAIEAARTGK